jgi:flavin reductase (DIM6/NTAB) family NADH-FMN oxidoreductase RutF
MGGGAEMGTIVERPLRDALRMIVPGPVVLISSMSKGQPNVMTAAWVTAQSLSPTLITIAIHPERLTHEFVSATEEFVVNIPILDWLSTVHEAGMISGRDGDKFAALSLEPADSALVEPPRVAGCPGYIECRVQDRVTAGDHDLFISEVVAVAADDELFDGFWEVETEAGRLLHHLGADRYAGLAHQYRATIPEAEEEG